MKKYWDKLWELAFKYESQIYLVAVMMFLFFLLTFWHNNSWQSSYLKLERENAALNIALDQADKALVKGGQLQKEQAEFIDFQSEIMQSHREIIEKQRLNLEEQNRILGILIKYLERIGHWPLKPLPPEKPISPGSWADLKIVLDEEKISHTE